MVCVYTYIHTYIQALQGSPHLDFGVYVHTMMPCGVRLLGLLLLLWLLDFFVVEMAVALDDW